MPAHNVGKTDKTIRIILGIGFLAAAIFLSGLWQWLALIAGAVMLVTALAGWCPPYSLLGINTRKGHDA